MFLFMKKKRRFVNFLPSSCGTLLDAAHPVTRHLPGRRRITRLGDILERSLTPCAAGRACDGAKRVWLFFLFTNKSDPRIYQFRGIYFDF